MAVTAYIKWAEAISQQEFETSLLPIILKSSKRSPESVVRSTALLFGMLKLDLSSSAVGILKEMLGMIRHAKEGVRYYLRPKVIENEQQPLLQS